MIPIGMPMSNQRIEAPMVSASVTGIRENISSFTGTWLPYEK